jgi:hypothetical protein
MKRLIIVVLGVLSTAIPSAQVARPDAHSQALAAALGDVAFEVVGQVSNAGTSSSQYGYVTFLKALTADRIFTTPDPAAQNEAAALVTFFTDATTERVIANGRLRIINRVGTTTVYFDEVPDGTFADPASFRDGLPVARFAYRQQVVLDAADNTFTVMNLLTTEDVEPFEIGGERVRIGQRRDQFRQYYSGAPPVGTPALNGVFAGYAVSIGPAKAWRLR